MRTTRVPAADLISSLHDDLLLRILSFLPASIEVARTSVLSRRWRHLWPNAIVLRFNVGTNPKEDHGYTQADRDEACRVIAAANATLLRRLLAGGPDVEVLDLCFVYSATENSYFDSPYVGYDHRHFHAADITSAPVAVWLTFAARHVTRRFKLTVPTVPKQRRQWEDEDEDDEEEDYDMEDVEDGAQMEDGEELVEEEHAGRKWRKPPFLPQYKYADEHEENRVLVAELPSTVRVEEMILTLGKAIIKVPTSSAGAFHALTDLLLSHAQLNTTGGHGRRLGQLLSRSCSPRLRRLQIKYIKGITDLRLDVAATLEELQLVCLRNLWSLDVDALGLRVLGVKECDDLALTRIKAPRLEVLACHGMGPADGLEFDSAASVGCIKELHLYSHRLRRHRSDADDNEDDDNSAVWLLRHCTAVDRLDVEVTWPWPRKILSAPYEDNVMCIPPLPNIINLRIQCAWRIGHAAGATVAKFIAKCAEIETLSIDIVGMTEECLYPGCICNHPKGWEDQTISLQHLRNVEIHNFLPYEGQMRLLRLLFSNTPALERMSITLQFILSEGRKAVDFHIPSYGGRWKPCDLYCDRKVGITWATRYEWTQVISAEAEQGTDLDGQCVF